MSPSALPESPIVMGRTWGGPGGAVTEVPVPAGGWLEKVDVCATSQYVQGIRFGFSDGTSSEWFGGAGTMLGTVTSDDELQPFIYSDGVAVFGGPDPNEPEDPNKCIVTRFYREGYEIKGFWGRAGMIVDAMGVMFATPEVFHRHFPKAIEEQRSKQNHLAKFLHKFPGRGPRSGWQPPHQKHTPAEPSPLNIPQFTTEQLSTWETNRAKLMRREPFWRRFVLRVGSFNLRYDNHEDRKSPQFQWSTRAPLIAEMMRFHKIDVLGVQEGLRNQLDELSSLLGPEYGWVGVGRTDGLNGGEFAAIFYRTSRISLLRNNTIWLSQTPNEVGSRGWDASMERIMSWAEFKDLRTDRNFVFFNTHFDHLGTECMAQSGLLVLKTIAAEMKRVGEGTPAFLTGDFNSDVTSHAYKIITGTCDDWDEHVEITDPNWSPNQQPYPDYTNPDPDPVTGPGYQEDDPADEDFNTVGDGSNILPEEERIENLRRRALEEDDEEDYEYEGGSQNEEDESQEEYWEESRNDEAEDEDEDATNDNAPSGIAARKLLQVEEGTKNKDKSKSKSKNKSKSKEERFVMFDSRLKTLLRPYGPPGTFMGGFGFPLAVPTKIIDFVFVDSKTTVLQHAVLTETVEDVFLSDHRPVVADVLFFNPFDSSDIYESPIAPQNKPMPTREETTKEQERQQEEQIPPREQKRETPREVAPTDNTEDEEYYSQEELKRITGKNKDDALKPCAGESGGFSGHQVLGIVALTFFLNSKQQSIRSWLNRRVTWFKTRRRYHNKPQHFL